MDDSLVRQYFEVYRTIRSFYVFPKDDFKYLKNLKRIKVDISSFFLDKEEEKFFISKNIKVLRINEKDKYIKINKNKFFLPMNFIFKFENEEEAFYFKMKYC